MDLWYFLKITSSALFIGKFSPIAKNNFLISNYLYTDFLTTTKAEPPKIAFGNKLFKASIPGTLAPKTVLRGLHYVSITCKELGSFHTWFTVQDKV